MIVARDSTGRQISLLNSASGDDGNERSGHSYPAMQPPGYNEHNGRPSPTRQPPGYDERNDERNGYPYPTTQPLGYNERSGHPSPATQSLGYNERHGHPSPTMQSPGYSERSSHPSPATQPLRYNERSGHPSPARQFLEYDERSGHPSPVRQSPGGYNPEGAGLRQRNDFGGYMDAGPTVRGSPHIAPPAPTYGSYPVHYGQPPSAAWAGYPSSMTPELTRPVSYDSRASNIDPVSPISPGVIWSRSDRPPPQRTGSSFSFYSTPSTATTPYEAYSDAMPPRRPQYSEGPASISSASSTTSLSSVPSAPPAPLSTERVGKRYPCKFRGTHSCHKTFTTSGHASRHSRIHIAEKAVHCSHPGCSKKFTRADNMKQHLETHKRDKPRSSVVLPSTTSSEQAVPKQPMLFYQRCRSDSLSADSLEQDDTSADRDTEQSSAGSVQSTDNLNTAYASKDSPQRPRAESGIESLIRASAMILNDMDDTVRDT